MSRQSILGRDNVVRYREKLCRDIVGQVGKISIVTEYF